MNINLDANAVTILAALGGAVFGAYATYLAAIKMYRITARDQARDTFYEVFAPLLDSLLRDPSNSPLFVLQGTAQNQRIVAQKLMNSLSLFEKWRFRRAWREYIGIAYPRSTQVDDWLAAFPNQYHEKSDDEGKRRQKYDLAVRNLKRLLEFTN
jgi:hypothetical protein